MEYHDDGKRVMEQKSTVKDFCDVGLHEIVTPWVKTDRLGGGYPSWVETRCRKCGTFYPDASVRHGLGNPSW